MHGDRWIHPEVLQVEQLAVRVHQIGDKTRHIPEDPRAGSFAKPALDPIPLIRDPFPRFIPDAPGGHRDSEPAQMQGEGSLDLEDSPGRRGE